MKQFYPSTQGRYSATLLVKLFAISFLLTVCTTASSQTLNFANPALVSGIDNTEGAVYRFTGVTADSSVDALISVDSLIDMGLVNIDATPSGAGTSFQPMLSSPGGLGLHYAVFTVTFVKKGTTYPTPVTNFSSIFQSVDGANQFLEFSSIDINNATWHYLSSTPTVSVSQSGNLIYGTATNQTASGGQGIVLTDSSAMWQVSSPVTTSFTWRLGFNQTVKGWNGNDLFSVATLGSPIQTIILPVTLLNFTAKQVSSNVLLAWSTSQEENLSHYIIERSYDNKSYDQAALIFTTEQPQAVNNYSYADPIKNTAATVIYYRLKMVDKDGKYSYSDIRTVRIGQEGGNAKITTYPNPVLTDLKIMLPANWQNKTVTCQLINTGGRIIKTITIQQATGMATITMQEVPAGMYFIKATSGNETSTQAIVKSKN